MARWVLLIFSLLFVGCIGDHGHRVHARRTPEEVARADRQPKDYAELIEAMKAQDMANELNGELRRSEGYSKLKHHRLREIMSVPEDPWKAFEDERRATLYRKWPDRIIDPPVVAVEEEKPAEGEAGEGDDDDDDEGEDSDSDDFEDE
jgi:hypothetical protein